MSADQDNLDLFALEPEAEPEPKQDAGGPTTGAIGPEPTSGGQSAVADTGDAIGHSAVADHSDGIGHSAVADPTDPSYERPAGFPAPAESAQDPGPRLWTVAEVNRGVRSLLEGTFSRLWVEGEVGRWTRSGPGHCYFTLKDERAQLKCVMFQSDAARLPMDPDEGMTVRVFGDITLYEARGEYQLTVRRLETSTGEGLWRLAFERLRKTLDAEGLLSADRKRPLPQFPDAVGVVTSLTGAALRDIVTVIRRRAPWTRVIVQGARVQGEGAAADVAAGIDGLAATGLVDVIIVGRGGGSVEDLWAFNEEPVARAIADCPVPIISAVGHEVDVTIADLVADARAATPSAAAEAVVPDREALATSLRTSQGRLARGLEGMVHRRRSGLREQVAHLGRAAHRIVEPRRQALSSGIGRMERAMVSKVAPRRQRAHAARDRIIRSTRALIQRSRHSLAAVTGKMEALSPLATLRRGYAVPLDDDGRLLHAAQDFEPGQRFTLRVVDGRVRCEALESESE